MSFCFNLNDWNLSITYCAVYVKSKTSYKIHFLLNTTKSHFFGHVESFKNGTNMHMSVFNNSESYLYQCLLYKYLNRNLVLSWINKAYLLYHHHAEKSTWSGKCFIFTGKWKMLAFYNPDEVSYQTNYVYKLWHPVVPSINMLLWNSNFQYFF